MAWVDQIKSLGSFWIPWGWRISAWSITYRWDRLCFWLRFTWSFWETLALLRLPWLWKRYSQRKIFRSFSFFSWLLSTTLNANPSNLSSTCISKLALSYALSYTVNVTLTFWSIYIVLIKERDCWKPDNAQPNQRLEPINGHETPSCCNYKNIWAFYEKKYSLLNTIIVTVQRGGMLEIPKKTGQPCFLPL